LFQKKENPEGSFLRESNGKSSGKAERGKRKYIGRTDFLGERESVRSVDRGGKKAKGRTQMSGETGRTDLLEKGKGSARTFQGKKAGSSKPAKI